MKGGKGFRKGWMNGWTDRQNTGGRVVGCREGAEGGGVKRGGKKEEKMKREREEGRGGQERR